MTSRLQLTVVNLTAAAAALLASLGVGMAFEATDPVAHIPSSADGLVILPAASCKDGKAPCRGLFDAAGTPVPVHPFMHIASGNIVSDGLLLALAEPNRIAAFSPFARELADNHRFMGRPSLTALEDVEGLIGLRPDLFIISTMSDSGQVRRMRDAGIAVFNLGPMEGLATLRANITTIALLLGAPERGQALIRRVDERLDALARGGRTSWRGLYVGIHGDKIYGGTVGSSLHDVIISAGLRDAAAEKFRGWPAFTQEDLLALNPDIIVTQSGMAAKMCQRSGLTQLAACQGAHGFIELPSPLLTDPGLAVLDAAEAVASKVRGWNAPPAGTR